MHSKEKTTSMRAPEISCSPCWLRLPLSVLYSFVYCGAWIIRSRRVHVIGNWTVDQAVRASWALLCKQLNCSSHVTCFCCALHSFIPVMKCSSIPLSFSLSPAYGTQNFPYFNHFQFNLCIFWILSISFSGFELSFYSGVYSPSIGFTTKIGQSAKQLVGLSGICIGVGEIFGGVLFGLLGSKTIKYGRDPIVIAGFVVHLFSFLLIYLNLPDDAPCEKFTTIFN